MTQGDDLLAAYLDAQATISPAERDAIPDVLTGLANRRAFGDALRDAGARAKRSDSDLAVVLVDVDNLKSVNSSGGTQQGDVVLRAVAHAVRDSLRDIDGSARYGGDEFAVMLPGSDQQAARDYAERLREEIGRLQIERINSAGTIRVTASCGAASARGASIDTTALLQDADKALHNDKPKLNDDE